MLPSHATDRASRPSLPASPTPTTPAVTACLLALSVHLKQVDHHARSGKCSSTSQLCQRWQLSCCRGRRPLATPPLRVASRACRARLSSDRGCPSKGVRVKFCLISKLSAKFFFGCCCCPELNASNLDSARVMRARETLKHPRRRRGLGILAHAPLWLLPFSRTPGMKRCTRKALHLGKTNSL